MHEDAKDALTRIPGMGIGSKGVVDVSPPGSSWDIKDSRDAPEDARDAPEDASDALTRVQGFRRRFASGKLVGCQRFRGCS